MRGRIPRRMKRRMTPERRSGKHSDSELWSLLSLALEKKKANKRKRDPDMYRNAVLELTVQKLNDEITDRCMKKIKRSRSDETYHWKGGESGWSMNASCQDDDILGIDDFFSKLSCKPCEEENSSYITQNMEEDSDHVRSTVDVSDCSVSLAGFDDQDRTTFASSPCRKETSETIKRSLEIVKLCAC